MKTTLLGLIVTLTVSSQIFSQWNWLNPQPHGNSNNRIAFGSNENEYLIVGNAGIIMKTTNDGVDWEIQNSGTDVSLKDIYIDNNNGIAVGNSGTILRTTDEGNTWSSINTGSTTNLTAVTFSTSNEGIITGWNGLILRTTDTGISWDSIPIPFTRRLYGVSFADAINGMAVGDSGAVFRTTNSGASWILYNIDDSTSLYDISYISPTTAFAVGWGGTILRTTNGGAAWDSVGFSDYIRWGVSFTDPNNGVVAGDLNTLVRTTDGGTTWQQVSGAGSIATNFHCVRFYNSTKGVAVGEWGAIFKTEDGGINWQIITKGVIPQGGNPEFVNRNSLYDVECINSTHAVISGSSEVFVTNDAGVSWTSVAMNNYPKLYDLDFANQSSGAMLGVDATLQGSIIFRTGNGGSDWSIQYNNNSVTLNAIDLSTPTHGVAVGNAGKILMTTNGGQNWNDHSITASDLYDVFLVDSLTGYAVGRYGFIYKTIDGGISWTQQSTNFAYNLWGVSFSDASNGIVVGEWITPPGISHGIILKTTDGGSNWSGEDLDPLALPLFLEDVTFTDNNNWYAVGVSVYTPQQIVGRIFKSEDAGVTWFEQSIPFKSTRHMNAISAFDNNALLAVGLEGMVLKTTNGGGTTSVEEISDNEIPSEFHLSQNYPNPFNPSTKIRWQSPVGSHQILKIYDVLGNEVSTLVDEYLPAGSYETDFMADELTSGVYFYKLQTEFFIETKKMILIK